MDGNELLRMFVLDAIADDYEGLEIIYGHVTKLCVRSGLSCQRLRILQALRELIESDLASAFKLSPTTPNEKIQGMPDLDSMNDYYYWLTDKGKVVQLSEFDGWPFESNGELRQDWVRPDM